MRILAIDPGSTDSGWVVLDGATRRPLVFGKTGNKTLLEDLYRGAVVFDAAVVEMVASYGMAVGADVFQTCVWVGRFVEAIRPRLAGEVPGLVKRHPVKLHHCHSARANDANIRQALVDRFAPGERNFGKGTKASPGWFHGFGADVWQAYALGVYEADRLAAAA